MESVVSKALLQCFSAKSNVALFAGSGVSARAGYPTWNELLRILADFSSKYDPDSAHLILERTKKGHFLQAATVYKTCLEIPEAEKYDQIAAPFLIPKPSDKLNSLIKLPFGRIVTTNYDRAMHDSYAKVIGRAPMTVELDDDTMVRAPWYADFYIARIHGRAEVPRSIVLDDSDFRRIMENACYIDFLRHILTYHTCIFLGFSFLDPGIDSVFRLIEERLKLNFPSTHLAILPNDSDQKLKRYLHQFNIRYYEYDSSDDHALLWEGIEEAVKKISEAKTIQPPATPMLPTDMLKRFTVTSYARLKLEKEMGPFRYYVVDGIIIDIVNRHAEQGTNRADIRKELSRLLALSENNLMTLVDRRIEVLSGKGWLRVSDDRLHLTNKHTDLLEDDIRTLARGVVYRYQVREGQQIFERIDVLVQECIEQIIIARGWDLGAHYAGASNELPNVFNTIRRAVEKVFVQLPEKARNSMTASIFDLFQASDGVETKILAELGRISFALQLVIKTPCSVLAHQTILPERLYLDASYLLPTIVEGHPLQTIYLDALNRLTKAGRDEGLDVRMIVLSDFLNEIISHRDLAIRDVETTRIDDDRDLLESVISYSGAENQNVYIGAYGMKVLRGGYKEKFSKYLKDYAPYQNEEELASFLARKWGVQSIRPVFKDKDRDTYEIFRNMLEYEYSKQAISKSKVLIEHEARQLCQIQVDQAANLRSLFVSADLRLRKVAQGPILGIPGNSIISSRAFVQLIDMLVGMSSDSAATVKLLWGGSFSDDSLQMRNYLIGLGLRYTDEAMTLALPEVLQKVVDEGLRISKSKGVSFSGGANELEGIRRQKYLGYIENDFYKNLADAINKKFPDQFNFPEKIRKERLAQHINRIKQLIAQYERMLKESKDKDEILFLKREVFELTELLDKYNLELKEV